MSGSSVYATVVGGTGARSLHLGTYGTVKVTVTSDGNVGIGEAAPGAKLTVAGNAIITSSNPLYMGGNATAIGSWVSRQYATGQNHYLGCNGFQVNNIGYVSPATTFLHIYSTGQAIFRSIVNNHNYHYIDTTSGGYNPILGFLEAGTRRAYINYVSADNYLSITTEESGSDIALMPLAGSVGIGTTNPGQKLHVNGNILVNAQILTPSGSNLALNPNTGLVTVGGALQTTSWLTVGGALTASSLATSAATGVVATAAGGGWNPAFHSKNTNEDSAPSYITLEKISASPVVGDYIGGIVMKGRTSTGVHRSFVEQWCVITNATNGSESGKWNCGTWRGGVEYPNTLVCAGNRVGIGTAPQQLLHLKSNDPKIYLEDGNAGTNEKVYAIYPAGSQYVLQTLTDAYGTGENVFIVDRTGTTVDKTTFSNGDLIINDNVGIGTDSPSAKLHVNGGLTSGADDDNRALFGYTAPAFI